MDFNQPKKKFVLVADDESEIVEIIKSELEYNLDCHVITSLDGLEAFQKTRNQKFDLIVVDYKIPRLNGVELLTALRESPQNRNIPVLFYTAYKDAVVSSVDKTYTHYEIMEKPTTNEKMIEKCRKMLEPNYFETRQNTSKSNLNFLGTFIEATKYTLTEMASLENVKEQKLISIDESEMSVDISATVSMDSPMFNGILTVSFSQELFVQLVSSILGEEITQIEETNHDAAAEILNVIFGQTKLRLSKMGFQLEKAIPSVIVGKNHKIFSGDNVKSLVVPFTCDYGTFYLGIGIKPRHK